MDINYEIARNIILAQAASDSGKYRDSIIETRGTTKMGYAVKPIYIKRAIDSINATRKCKFTYWVVKEGDQNGYPSVLVYFEFRMGKEVGQVSFHNPVNSADILYKYIGKGTPTEWNRKPGGSSECCAWLRAKYNIAK